MSSPDDMHRFFDKSPLISKREKVAALIQCFSTTLESLDERALLDLRRRFPRVDGNAALRELLQEIIDGELMLRKVATP